MMIEMSSVLQEKDVNKYNKSEIMEMILKKHFNTNDIIMLMEFGKFDFDNDDIKAIIKADLLPSDYVGALIFSDRVTYTEFEMVEIILNKPPTYYELMELIDSGKFNFDNHDMQKIINMKVLPEYYICRLICNNRVTYTELELMEIIFKKFFTDHYIVDLIKFGKLSKNNVKKLIDAKLLTSYYACYVIIKGFVEFSEGEIMGMILDKYFDACCIIIFIKSGKFKFSGDDIKKMMEQNLLNLNDICSLMHDGTIECSEEEIMGMNIIDLITSGKFKFPKEDYMKEDVSRADMIKRINKITKEDLLDSYNNPCVIYDAFSKEEIMEMNIIDLIKSGKFKFPKEDEPKFTKDDIQKLIKENSLTKEDSLMNENSLDSNEIYLLMLDDSVKYSEEEIMKIILDKRLSSNRLMDLIESDKIKFSDTGQNLSEDNIKKIIKANLLSSYDVFSLISDGRVTYSEEELMEMIFDGYFNSEDIRNLIQSCKFKFDEEERNFSDDNVTKIIEKNLLDLDDICYLILDGHVKYSKEKIMEMILSECFNYDQLLQLIKSDNFGFTDDDIQQIIQEILNK